VVVVLGVFAGGVVIFSQKKSVVVTPGEAIAPTPTPAVALTTWTDAAGFSFQYPKDLSVNKHEEDNANYAHVELTNKDHPGKIIVWVSDAPTAWPPEGGTTLDTTLGGLAAKKILTTAPVKTLSVGTISDNLLFNIEATLTDSEYWQKIHDTIVGSFIFTPDSSAGSGQPSSGQASTNSVDEEEVIQ